MKTMKTARRIVKMRRQTKLNLSAPQAKRLALIDRGFANRIPVKRGAFKAFDQKLLMSGLYLVHATARHMDPDAWQCETNRPRPSFNRQGPQSITAVPRGTLKTFLIIVVVVVVVANPWTTGFCYGWYQAWKRSRESKRRARLE